MFRTFNDRRRFKKQKVDKNFIQKYRIKRLIVSVFYSQINEMIKRKHISIKDALKVNAERREKMNSLFSFSDVSRSNDYKKIYWNDISANRNWNENRVVHRIECFKINLTNFILRKSLYNRRFFDFAKRQIQRKNENLKKKQSCIYRQ